MSEKMTLAQCPIGLFLSSYGNLCLKTEYGDNEGRIDAYIVDSGEFFWGEPPQTIESQRAQIVEPFDFAAALRAERARWREPMMDATAHLTAAVSAYEKFVGRHDRRGRADALFKTRYGDFLRAIERAHAALSTSEQKEESGS